MNVRRMTNLNNIGKIDTSFNALEIHLRIYLTLSLTLRLRTESRHVTTRPKG